MKKDFETILDKSLSRLKQKESIEACLGRYLQYAAQLEPLLRTALKIEVLKDTEPPSTKAMAAGRERFLQEAARLQAERATIHKPTKGLARRRRLMLSVAAAILVALLLALAALAGFEASDTLRRLYHWWETRVPQPTMTQPATDTPWPTMTPSHTPTATHTLEPTDTPVPTMTTVPPTDTPMPTVTSVPPTDTPVPTMTTVPPTDTPYPDDDTDDDSDDTDDDSGDDDEDDDDDDDNDDDDDD